MQLFTHYDQHIEMTVKIVRFNVTLLHIEGWGAHWSWIGLRYVDGVWRWQGRITSSVSSSDSIWIDDPTAPENNKCGYTFRKSSSLEKIHDCLCTYLHHYICERPIGQ